MTTQPTRIVGYTRTNPDGTVELFEPAPELERIDGEIWVEKLPGHSRAAYVRKPKPYRRSPFGLTAIAETLSCSPRATVVDRIKEANAASSAPLTRYYVRSIVPPTLFAQPTGGQTVTLTPQSVVSQGLQNPPPAVVQASPAEVGIESGVQPAVLVKQTCIECGNVRSPWYQLRHAMNPDEMPRISICRKCATKETSSEDSDNSYDKYRKKKDRRGHRRGSRTTDDGSSYTREERSRTERYRSPSRHGRHSHRSGTRSDSIDRTRPVYARTHARRASSSPERVHTVHRRRYVRQASPSRSRGRSRTSRSRHSSWEEISEETYTNNDGEVGYTSLADESPRTHTAEHDRIPELGVLHGRSNSIRGSPRNVDRQEFDRRPDETRPRSRPGRVRVCQEGEGPRSYRNRPADQDQTHSTGHYTSNPDAHLREYQDRPRSVSARIPLLRAQWSPGHASNFSSISRRSSRRGASTDQNYVDDEW